MKGPKKEERIRIRKRMRINPRKEARKRSKEGVDERT